MDNDPFTDDLDLANARSERQLTQLLKTLHTRADQPSLRKLERWAVTHSRPSLSRTQVSEMLAGKRWPTKAMMLAFVEACGVPSDGLSRWRTAWERIASARADQAATPAGLDPSADNLLRSAEERASKMISEAEFKSEQIISEAEERARQIEQRVERGAKAAESLARVEADHALRTRNEGFLISFEGIDRIGRTTQADLLSRWLRDQGYTVTSAHEPESTTHDELLLATLEEPGLGLLPYPTLVQALLFTADCAVHVESVVQPALDRGEIVVTDWYTGSSAVQQVGIGLPPTDIVALNRWVTGQLIPDMTIVLDCPPELLQSHAGDAEIMDVPTLKLLRLVRAAYHALAVRHPDRYLLLDSTAERPQISQAIQRHLAPRFPVLKEGPA
jgi:dTMP kinase